MITSLMLFAGLMSPFARAEKWDAEMRVTAPGALTLQNRSAFSDGQKVDLQGGPVTIETEDRGRFISSVFHLEAGGRRYSFAVPREAYVKSKFLGEHQQMSVAIPADRSGQGVALQLEIQSVPLSATTERGRQSCKLESEGFCPLRAYTQNVVCDFDEKAYFSVKRQKVHVVRSIRGTVISADGRVLAEFKPVPKYDFYRTDWEGVSACGKELKDAGWREHLGTRILNADPFAPSAPSGQPPTAGEAALH